MKFRDWTDLGVLPLQDHDPQGVPVEMRMQMVGGRIIKQNESGSGPNDFLAEYAIEGVQGTLGDLHPWCFWQTDDIEKRGMGSWSMAWGSAVSDPDVRYGAKTLPIRDDALHTDKRYAEKVPNWPRSFSALPKGTMGIVSPATEERKQHDVFFHADPRIIVPQIGGSGECGTLFVDLQPTDEPCMDGATSPGTKGRAARVQSAFRVVPMKPGGTTLLGTQAWPGVAWNLARSQQDNIAGLGMVWGELERGAAPTTPTGINTPRGPITLEAGEEDDLGPSPDEAGKFEAKKTGGFGVGFAAQIGASGPFHIGHADDKHHLGEDADGNPMRPLHISDKAYIAKDSFRDGPWNFRDELYPEVEEHDIPTRCYISFDPRLTHPFVGGQRQGKWDVWTTVPYLTPPITPGDPGTPYKPPGGGPTTPGGPGVPGPSTPGPGGPTPGEPTPAPPITPDRGYPPWEPNDPGTWTMPPDFAGSSAEVGDTSQEDRGLYSILHPHSEGFAAVAFRPQFWQAGYAGFEHSPQHPEVIRRDESYRPQVLVARAWGAQSDGEWDYTLRPRDSRARGGTASGGILFSPPEFEMEDYFGILSGADVTSTSTQAYVTAAPGVGFALGRPETDGGITDGSIVLQQFDLGSSQRLQVGQFSSGTLVELFHAYLVGSTPFVSFSGTGSLKLPSGTTAEQPGTPFDGEFRYNSDEGAPEWWDGSAWQVVAAVP